MSKRGGPTERDRTPVVPGRAALLPLSLTAARAALAPVLVLLALFEPLPTAFGICLVLAFVSDIFDGMIARRLGVATAALRRLDSLADSLFYAAATYAVWRLHPEVIERHLVALGVLVALEVARYVFDLAKFRREASYHMWSSKVWGVTLFIAFFALLALGDTGPVVTLPIWFGIAADLEGLAISVVLDHWRADVPTLAHAWRIRRSTAV